MQNSKINFTSNIRLANLDQYSKEIRWLSSKKSVPSPWTYKEIVVAPRAYTTGVMDCSAGGLIDGKKALMFHLSADREANSDFSVIEKTILDKFNGKTEGLRGFLLGSRRWFGGSIALFENLKNFMTVHNIPFSMMKGSKCVGGNMVSESFDIAYNAKHDLWTVTSKYITNQLERKKNDINGILTNTFDEFSIADGDKLVN